MIAYKVVLVTNGLHIAVNEATIGAYERAAALLAAGAGQWWYAVHAEGVPPPSRA